MKKYFIQYGWIEKGTYHVANPKSITVEARDPDAAIEEWKRQTKDIKPLLISMDTVPKGQREERRCKYCGTDHIVADANAAWNPDTREYELGGVYDSVSCSECGDETEAISCWV